MKLSIFCRRLASLLILVKIVSSSNSNDTISFEECDKSTRSNPGYSRYFTGMEAIYKATGADGTCLPVQKECGWPKRKNPDKLPLLVFSLGLEGAGHHLYSELLNKPLFDCVWINGRHYHRDLGDGVARTTLQSAYSGFKEAAQLRAQSRMPPCKRIFDAEDSFPTGAIRAPGRVFMRPDIVHLQDLDGILYDLKFLIILRNTTVYIVSIPYVVGLLFVFRFIFLGYCVVRTEKKLLYPRCSRVENS
jgi:hypothetical protein